MKLAMLDSEAGSGVIAQHVTFFFVVMACDWRTRVQLRSQHNKLSQPNLDGSTDLATYGAATLVLEAQAPI